MTEKFDFWKTVGAAPAVIAAADQADMEAKSYVDKIMKAYNELLEEDPEAPLVAVALGFFHTIKAADEEGYFFISLAMAELMRRIHALEQEKSDG